MKVLFAYGKGSLNLEVPKEKTSILKPRFTRGIRDEKQDFLEAVRKPINSQPIREILKSNERIAIVVPDATRPFPTKRILPLLLQELSFITSQRFVIIIGSGSHKAAMPEEIAGIVGRKIYKNFRVVSHDAFDQKSLLHVGRDSEGRSIKFNSEYVIADRRIVMGFVEPHFMAGFSGGYKGVFPALADIDSIMHYHRAEVIADLKSTWGNMAKNPTQQQIQEKGAMLPLDFLINVTMNIKKQITGFYCGHPLSAHKKACELLKKSSMIPCEKPFPFVITTNSGYPLDQNLYQTVKGLSAAAQIVEENGLILMLSECINGFPEHGNFKRLLFDHNSPKDILRTILCPGFRLHDQWEAQIMSQILIKAQVAIHCRIPEKEIRRAHLEPVKRIEDFVKKAYLNLKKGERAAALPYGPLSIPYLTKIR